MAVKIQEGTRQKSVVLRMFARQAVKALKRNFRMQHVFPTEVYPGYTRVNKWRMDHGYWFSTGQGARSFEASVVSAEDGRETIKVLYNDYLRYVDMGVGQERPWEVVEHEKKARYDRRYISYWQPHLGSSARPAIMMEMRHIEARMQRFLEDYYGEEVNTQVFRTFSGLDGITLNI